VEGVGSVAVEVSKPYRPPSSRVMRVRKLLSVVVRRCDTACSSSRRARLARCDALELLQRHRHVQRRLLRLVRFVGEHHHQRAAAVVLTVIDFAVYEKLPTS
jgi:hypothetical protein